MKRYKVLPLLLFFTLLLGGKILSEKKSHSFFNVITLKNPIQIDLFYEAIPFLLNNDSYSDFIFFQLKMPPSANDPEIPALALIYEKENKFTAYNNLSPEMRTTHFRHWLEQDFNNDSVNDLLIVDHGGDAPPYPGGISRLFYRDTKGELKGQQLEADAPQYTYHACAADIDKDNDTDIFLNNNQNDFSPPFFYIKNNNKWTVDKKRFSDGIFRKKFFSCSFIDLNNDHLPELFLGRHDMGLGFTDDIILWNKRGHFSSPTNVGTYSIEHFIDWGTTESIVADINNDKRNDLILLLHNSGFNKGAIKVLKQNQAQGFVELSLKTGLKWEELGNSFFIPWAEVTDINEDGFLDIIAPIRTSGAPPFVLKRKLLVLINQKGEYFQEISDPFLENLDTIFSAWKIKNTNKIALFTYSGKIHLLTWKK